MQHMMHRLDDVALTTTWLQEEINAHAVHPRLFRKHVPSLTLIIQDDEYRQTNKAGSVLLPYYVP